jgi:acyl-CoA synthetase (AMP-forming)/AMP-acid ligase II
MQTPTCLHQFLEMSAQRNAGQIALVHGATRVSYGRLNAEANGCAAFLRRAGIAEGARVAILLENGLEFVTAFYGTLKAGAIAVPLNPESKAEELRVLFADLRPQAVVCCGRPLEAVSQAGAPSLRLVVTTAPAGEGAVPGVARHAFAQMTELAEERNPGHLIPAGSLANIIYTSGSSGTPKGVMLSHANIIANTLSICQYLQITEDDVQMVVLPFFYVMGLSLLNTHLAAGGRLVINNSFTFPASVLNEMVQEGVTAFSGVPSTYAFLLHRSPLRAYRERLKSLRYCSQAGGHMPAATKRELRQALPSHTAIVVMYGATEASARLTWLDPACFESKLGSIGKPIPGVEVRVLDEQGREVGVEEVGELVARGPNIMQGYLNAPEATAAVLDRHGYHTGDLGWRDADGFLYVSGRKDAIVKVGGHRINPQEIEDILMETGLLVETAVVALPDALLGNRLVAVCIPVQADLAAERILAAVSLRVPRHKVPAEVRFVEALPKNANGKLDRRGCARLVSGEEPAAG